MADVKIPDLTAIGTVAPTDLLEIVDVSDTTHSAAGSSRKVQISQLTTTAVLPTDYVIASSDVSAAWLAVASSTVTAGADCASAITAAFASGRKRIVLVGTLNLLSAVSVTPIDDLQVRRAEGSYIQCGPQVGADPNNPSALLTITGTRTSVLSGVTLGAQISAGARSATFSSIGSIVANDYVLLHITTLFGPNRSTEQTGEIIKVRSVSGTTLRFFTPVRYTYATTASAFSLERYVMPRGLDLNIDIRGNSSTMVRQRPLHIKYMLDVIMNKVRLSNGTWCNYGVRCEEIYNLFFDNCWGQDFCDGHAASSTYSSDATTPFVGTLVNNESIGSTTVEVTVTAGTFASPQATFAWLGNPGAVDLDNLIASTAVIGATFGGGVNTGGEGVRVINVTGTAPNLVFTLASPGLVNAASAGARVNTNGSYLGYAYEMVGCTNVRGTIDGEGCRHLWDVKSFNKRPVAFNSVLTGYASDCAGSPFSTHGSCDQAFHENTTSEGCGGHEVFRGVHHGSKNATCIHPTRWTRGIFDQHQSYPAMTWCGEGIDDGGTAGDGLVIQDPYLDAAGCPFLITGVWSRDRARGVRIVGRRYFAPTAHGVWLAGPESSGLVDIAVSGANQYAVVANPEQRACAVQFCTETGGTAGMSVRAMRVRLTDGDGLFTAAILGARGPSVYIEGNATDVAASNSELDIDVEKRALGTSQTSSSAQIVIGAGYHNRIGIKAQFPGTLAASAVSPVGTLKRPIEWQKYSRFSDLASPAALDGDTLGLTPPSLNGGVAWTQDPVVGTTNSHVITSGQLTTAAIWCPPATITAILFQVSATGTFTTGQSFAGLWANAVGGTQLKLSADLAAALTAASAGTTITATLTSSYVHTGGYIRVGMYGVFSAGTPGISRGASTSSPNSGMSAPYRFSHSGGTTYTTTPPATLPTLSTSAATVWFELIGTPL